MLRMIGKAAESMPDSKTAQQLVLEIENRCDPGMYLEPFDIASRTIFRRVDPEYLRILGDYWEDSGRAAMNESMNALNSFTLDG